MLNKGMVPSTFSSRYVATSSEFWWSRSIIQTGKTHLWLHKGLLKTLLTHKTWVWAPPDLWDFSGVNNAYVGCFCDVYGLSYKHFANLVWKLHASFGEVSLTFTSNILVSFLSPRWYLQPIVQETYRLFPVLPTQFDNELAFYKLSVIFYQLLIFQQFIISHILFGNCVLIDYI